MFLLFLLPFFNGTAYAYDVSNHLMLEDRARYRIKYSGIFGAIFDEYVRFMSNTWEDSIDLYYEHCVYDDGNYTLMMDQIELLEDDYDRGRWSDARRYWWHYLPDWGPIKTYYAGPSNDIINIGPVRVTKNFGFKMKHYKVDITRRWKLKVKPKLKLTGQLPILKKLAVGLELTYRLRGIKLFKATVEVGYNGKYEEGYAEFCVELTNW